MLSLFVVRENFPLIVSYATDSFTLLSLIIYVILGSAIPLNDPCDGEDICEDGLAQCRSGLCLCRDDYYEAEDEMICSKKHSYLITQKIHSFSRNLLNLVVVATG